MDALANGRRIKCLTVVDDFSRECVDIAVDYGMGGQYVTRVLDQAGQFRGYPKAIRTDQGPAPASIGALAGRRTATRGGFSAAAKGDLH